MLTTLGWTLAQWQQAYAGGQNPADLLTPLLEHLHRAADPAWISLLDTTGLNHALQALTNKVPADLPLYGVPVAVKDNIDALGFATTAACPAFSYRPNADAEAIARLKAAGAIIIGKTNLDQFATGLVGTRSPYGAVANSFNTDFISGGSSSGSASVVARGLVPVALGTDTAGSGRVPAGLNNLVGLKPTRGAISLSGVVPACQSLDCVSVFALTTQDAGVLYDILRAEDATDPFSRQAPAALSDTDVRLRAAGRIQKLAIPVNPPWFGDQAAEAAWQATLAQLPALGVELTPMDFSPLFELAALLYEGPWVAERHAAVGDFINDHPDDVNPVVAGIIRQAEGKTATEVFKAIYRKEALLKQIDRVFSGVDALLVPTAPRFPTLAQVDADPVLVNSQMGTYTNFVNLADLCALSVPAGFRADGLPFGITLISGAWKDSALQDLAAQWLNQQPTPLGATDKPRSEEYSVTSGNDKTITVAVVGAHLSGMPLNSQLVERNSQLLEQTTTAPCYRLYALPNTTPPKPGLRRVTDGSGKAIILEVWQMPEHAFGSFVDLIPSPLGIGKVELADGRWVNGFICEGYAFEGARDVTEFGGWRAYIKEGN
ncbi:MAG: allophanate hydrolase [Marinobacter sp.]|nr:allophanate hydrolase [Marinobacter sp.]